MHSTLEATERRWRNRPVLREIDDRRVRRLGRLVLVMAVATAPMAVYLLQQNESLKLVYELNAVRAEQDRLIEEERRLSLERARLESLERIERWAERKHGLTRPAPGGVVVVRAPEPAQEEPPAAARNREPEVHE